MGQTNFSDVGGATVGAIAMPLLDLLNSPTTTWETLRPGIEVHRLYEIDGGSSAALLRYQKGAILPRHRHVGMEHVYILQGSQRDENGLHEAGSILVHFPGSSHNVSSETGCIALAIWEKPVEFE